MAAASPAKAAITYVSKTLAGYGVHLAPELVRQAKFDSPAVRV